MAEERSPTGSGEDETQISQSAHPARLGILASGKGSNFVALALAIQAQTLLAQIQVVITNNPEAPVRQRAEPLGIPVVVIHHREFDQREAFDQAVVDQLRAYHVDWVIMAGWMRRATAVLVDAFPSRIVNIHPSLLPSFPGVRAWEQALNYGVKITGCTVHYVTLEVDQGPIIRQAAVPVLPDDTPESLHQRIQEEEHRILPKAVAECLAEAQRQQVKVSKGSC